MRCPLSTAAGVRARSGPEQSQQSAIAPDMPQSLVSRNVARLEQQCSEQLFRRAGRSVVLTESGEYVLPRIEHLAREA